MASTPAPGEILCPDPSAHDHGQRTSDQASRAALLAAASSGAERKSSSSDNLLTEDGKLSSRGAASSLKYAKAQDLPSFPSRGATSNASLAAAVLAKDHTMKELWQPEASVAGTKAAAKAQKDGGHLDLWEPSASAAGNSAAVMAMRTKGLSPQVDRGYTDTGRTNSLVAATKVHNTGRQRAGSMPAPAPPQYPDSQNSTKNALNAAVKSHRTSTRMAPDGWDSEANQAARIKNLGGRMDREMFGEHPPVEPELEEQRHQAALRASAVSMAKQMYEYQNRAATPTDTSSLSGGAGTGAEVAHRRNQSATSQPDLKEEAMRYIHLQDAAHKIAQERLAKLDKEMSEARYREYYGYGDTSPKKSRLSVRRRPRASSEGDRDLDDSDDERQARQIRSQMSQLSTGINTVDVKQRQQDRAKLMAAAEKRVHARMHDMDEKVFQETGRVSQAMQDEWEAKAREKAERQKAERDAAAPTGKVAIGGGKFMDQAEIEAIAAARLKPTLEEINENAEKMRARDEEIKRQQDARETAQMEEKMKQQQQQAEFKRVKEQDKATARKEAEERRQAQEAVRMEGKRKEQEQKAEFKRIRDQDKAAAKREKEERKAAQKAEKEQAKARRSEEQRKSREARHEEISVLASGAAIGEVADKVKEDKEREEQKDRDATIAASAALGEVADGVKKDKEKEEAKEQEAREDASVAIGEIAGRVKEDRDLEEKRRSKERRRSSAAAQAGGETLAEIAAKVKQDREIEEQPEAEDQHGSVVPVAAAGAAGVAGVAAYEVLDRQDTGPAPATIGPHDSDLANIVDPRVQPDPDKQKSPVRNPETGPAPNTIGPHKSDIANILDPRVKPDPEVQRAPVQNPGTGPAPNTIGPHRSDTANILDPRVKPDPKVQKDAEPATEGPHKSDLANVLDPRVDSTPKAQDDEGPKDDKTRDVAGVAVAGGAAATAATVVATTYQEKDTTKDVREDPKRKSSSRGVFGRLTDRFKRRVDEDKRAAEVAESKEEPDQPSEGAPVLGMPAMGASLAAAGGIEEEHAREEEAAPETEHVRKEEQDDDIDRSRAAEALIGVGAVGGAGMAAGVAAATSGQDEEVAKDDVSSLSTTDEEDNQDDLEQYTTTAEHSGHYTFATPSPVEGRKRLDLERHISAIQDSSESDSDDDDLLDTDDEDDPEADRGRVRQVAEVVTVPATEERKAEAESSTGDYGAYERAGQGGVATEGELENKFATYEFNDPNRERTLEMEQRIQQIEQEKAEMLGDDAEQPQEKEGILQKVLSKIKGDDEEKQTSKEESTAAAEEERAPSPVSPIRPEEEIVLVNSASSPDAPQLVVGSTPEAEVGSAPAEESPVTARSTSQEDSSPSQQQKERKGIKGLFNKLTSKPENKLSKRGQERPSNASEDVESEGGSFVGGAKLTGGDEKDGVVSPITTTTVGVAEQDGKADGTVGDKQHLTGVGSSARDESPSSFKRHQDSLADPDDVSSSGAEEEEVKRGRAGRLARKLGLARGKEKESQVSSGAPEETTGGEEQFEEARDQFDESLAPPPAFAGQAKTGSQSPARETRFQEQF